ncbi:MAG: homocysteine S-methyltransferase family protein [Clostridia bacterium]
MNILDILGKRTVFYDGATGTFLQENGLEKGALPERMNASNPQVVERMHKQFIDAGSDIILTNTFGANSLKFSKNELSEVISAAISNAKNAVNSSERDVFISYDLGPTGKLLQPMGDLSFDDAYELFKEQILLCRDHVDLVTIETMTDLYELKAAILAVKENSNLPVFTTVSYDFSGHLLTGSDIQTVVATLEGLGVDALGVNCGMGPAQMKEIAREILSFSQTPLVVNPNAGLPVNVDGKTTFDIDADEFSQHMKEICEMGAWIVGGCCGTTDEHIKKMVDLCKNINPKSIETKNFTAVTSYAKCVYLNDDPKIIGERINPTGKPKFRQALKDNDLDYILDEAFEQQDAGAHILDVNVGLPEIDEPRMMRDTVREIQSIIKLPLQIDTSDVIALEQGLRYYNGKAMVNSVNGKKESMEAVFPLIKKYGGVVVGLTLDEDGIPESAEKRFEIAKKIILTAKKYGIDKKNIVIDPLAMTISTDQNSANVTLKSLKKIHSELGVNTVLGVSNISFGLPNREKITSSFFTLAMHEGLTSAIINPKSESMMSAYHSYRALKGFDPSCMSYIENNAQTAEKIIVKDNQYTIEQIILSGLKERARAKTEELLLTEKPLDIINNRLIKALDTVGQGFEKGTIFLPQLLMSAETAKLAFEVVKSELAKTQTSNTSKGRIILATVKGDIHDIGKNIVKVLLENYGFDIIDLGKDVDPQKIIDCAIENNIKLVGLSALMTTTVPSMADTIKLIQDNGLDCKVMVGGAVLTQEYADMIHADFYSKDALGSVFYANDIFGV